MRLGVFVALSILSGAGTGVTAFAQEVPAFVLDARTDPLLGESLLISVSLDNTTADSTTGYFSCDSIGIARRAIFGRWGRILQRWHVFRTDSNRSCLGGSVHRGIDSPCSRGVVGGDSSCVGPVGSGAARDYVLFNNHPYWDCNHRFFVHDRSGGRHVCSGRQSRGESLEIAVAREIPIVVRSSLSRFTPTLMRVIKEANTPLVTGSSYPFPFTLGGELSANQTITSVTFSDVLPDSLQLPENVTGAGPFDCSSFFPLFAFFAPP